MNVERKLATIELVREVLPIENADAIEKIRVRDWWCVAKKGEFQAGDSCVYFEIDAVLPVTYRQFEFLAKGSKPVTVQLESGASFAGYRLKTVRLRGQISQGLALPLSSFGLDLGACDGLDVTEALGIHKYQPPMPTMMGNARGPFPGFIPRTDEERVQNMRAEIQAHLGQVCYVTEKLDGTSLTMFRDHEGQPHVCSRGQDLKEGDNLYWQAARPYLAELPEGIAIQGEVVGEGVQGNPLKLKGRRLYAFSAYSFKRGRYLDFGELIARSQDMNLLVVPEIDSHFVLSEDIAGMVAMADGKSRISPESDREGIVIRSHDGENRISFKCISNRYLLKGDR